MGVLSGSIYTYFGPSGNHYKLQVDWSATQDIANNQSTITAQLRMWSDPTYSMYASNSTSGSVTIDGTAYGVTKSGGISTGGGAWVDLGSAQSKTITHNADGTRDFSLSGSFTFSHVNLSGTYVDTVNIPASTFTLNPIPRASTVTSAVSWTAGTQNLDVTIARADASFYHTLQVFVADTSGSANPYGSYIAQRTGIGTSTTITFSQSEITQIYTKNSGYESRPVILRCFTYNSAGTQIGGYQDKTGYVYAVPTAYTTINTNNTFNIGTTSLPYSLNNYTTGSSGGFTYDFIVTIGSGATAFTKTFPNLTAQTGNLAFTTGTSGTSDVEKMYAATPNSNSVSGTVQVRTKYNGVYTEDGIPSTDVTNITANVINSNPIFSATGITYADTNSTVTAITGDPTYIVQNKSTVSVTIPVANRATAKNGATMSYYTATLGGVSQSGNWSSSANVVISLGVINLSANSNISITAYDSRGNGTPVTVAAKILAYSPPVVNTKSARTNGFDPTTNITLSGTYSTLTIGSTPKNALQTVTYAYKKTTDGSYPTGANPGAPTTFTYTTSGTTYSATTASLTLDSALAWNTQVVVSDKLSTVTITNTVAAGTPVLFIDATKKSVGVGQFPANSNTLEVTGDFYLNGKVYRSEETATIPATAGWYRIATSASGIANNMGEFEIYCPLSSHHSYTKLIAGIHYGDSDCSLVQLSHSCYGSPTSSAITQARIVYNPTYSGNYAYLEVYCPNASSFGMTVRLTGGSGWTVLAPNTAGSIPSSPTGYTSTLIILSTSGIASSGDVSIQRGNDLVLMADPSTGTGNAADTGDIVWQDSAGTEVGRFWRTASALYYRMSPTGASYTLQYVDSYGDNSNGHYVRYADGTQVCWQYWNYSSTSGLWKPAQSYATGVNGYTFYYQYLSENWTFPAPFISTPSVVISGDLGGANMEHHDSYGISTTVCTLESGVFNRGGTDTSAPPLERSAIVFGRWK